VALETFVAPIRTDEKSIVEKGLHEVFSPRSVNRCAAAVWAMCGMSSFEYELHDAPFRAELPSVNHRCERGWGSTKWRSTLCGNLHRTRQTRPISIGGPASPWVVRMARSGTPKGGRRRTFLPAFSADAAFPSFTYGSPFSAHYIEDRVLSERCIAPALFPWIANSNSISLHTRKLQRWTWVSGRGLYAVFKKEHFFATAP
jgi:hypothetical protein